MYSLKAYLLYRIEHVCLLEGVPVFGIELLVVHPRIQSYFSGIEEINSYQKNKTK
jgi:hypothetical protein